jgi:hypothetical protein
LRTSPLGVAIKGATSFSSQENVVFYFLFPSQDVVTSKNHSPKLTFTFSLKIELLKTIHPYHIAIFIFTCCFMTFKVLHCTGATFENPHRSPNNI